MQDRTTHTLARTPRRGALSRRGALVGLAGVATFAVAGACTPPADPVADLPVPVTQHVVTASVPGVSFAKAADVIGDGDEELVVSRFGQPTSSPGTVTLYERGATLDDWTNVPVITAADGVRFPNDTEVADIDGDGLQDLVVSGGFFSCSFSGTGCGSLLWMQQGPAGTFTRHDVIAPDNERFYHRTIVTDVDGDGITDLLTVGETFDSARTEWYRGTSGTGAARFGSTPLVIGAGGGSLPVVEDVDGDGDDDVVSPQYFQGGDAVVWFERVADPSPAAPAGQWVRHSANWGIGKGFEIELVRNLRGDGVDRWIATNHQNDTFQPETPSAVWELTPPADPTGPWAAAKLSTGIQARPSSPTSLAPGLFGAGDVDGDGRTDLVVSGDGDARLFTMLQGADGSFSTYVLDRDMGQAGGAEVTDLDGDGHAEAMFTSYEQGVVKLYEFGG